MTLRRDPQGFELPSIPAGPDGEQDSIIGDDVEAGHDLRRLDLVPAGHDKNQRGEEIRSVAVAGAPSIVVTSSIEVP